MREWVELKEEEDERLEEVKGMDVGLSPPLQHASHAPRDDAPTMGNKIAFP